MIYISGAITGTKDYKERFTEAEYRLKAKGYDKIINPARVCAELPELEHDEYMSICYAMLSLCNEIYMMKGWEKSKGATKERLYAEENNIKRIFEEE